MDFNKEFELDSILAGSSIIYADESTPIKRDHNDNDLFNHSNCPTPIKQQKPSHNFHSPGSSVLITNNQYSNLNISLDIDSAYFSHLSKKSNNDTLSPCKFIRTTSLFSNSRRSLLQQTFNSPHKLTDDPSQSHLIYTDFLFELYNRSMFHVIKLILRFLSVRDYLKVSNVSKTWSNVLKEDLRFNKLRLKEIRAEKKKALSTKENNVSRDISVTQNLHNILQAFNDSYSSQISFDTDKQCVNTTTKPIISLSPEMAAQQSPQSKLCSLRSKRNLKRL